MAIRTALLNWNNISRDTDFSKYIESVSEPWVIEWLEVSATKVWIWKAFVPCLRTNGETIYALVYISSEVSISGNGDVFIEVSQTYIDDWELANEDWTGIATIQVWTMPSKNALKLATITSWTPTDARNMIPKVWELNTQIESIFDSLEDLDERVEALEEAGAIDHLEESGLVWELYTLSDTLFKQNTPTLADSTLDCNVSDTSANTQIHIQRIGSGVASNQLKLKVKMVWSSTQNLKVEVRKWVQVTVTEWVEAYWYWNQVIASGSIAYSDISSDYAEKTITLDNNFWWTKGELLDIVVYMDTVNASNYYCVACDSTQYSEWFGYVSVNGSTRTRSKLMPYGISEGFAQSMLVKTKSGVVEELAKLTSSRIPWFPYSDIVSATLTKASKISISWLINLSASSNNLSVAKVVIDGVNKKEYQVEKNKDIEYLYEDNVVYPAGTVVKLQGQTYNNTTTTFKQAVINWILFDEVITIKGYPNWIKSLWDLGTITLYGIYNWEYKGGIMQEESVLCSTWEITLWNAVWFVRVFYNWKYIKIPYYND